MSDKLVYIGLSFFRSTENYANVLHKNNIKYKLQTDIFKLDIKEYMFIAQLEKIPFILIKRARNIDSTFNLFNKSSTYKLTINGIQHIENSVTIKKRKTMMKISFLRLFLSESENFGLLLTEKTTAMFRKIVVNRISNPVIEYINVFIRSSFPLLAKSRKHQEPG